MDNLRELLKISEDRLTEVNDLLTDPDNETVGQIVKIVEKYGGPQEINRKAAEAGKFENLITRLKKTIHPMLPSSSGWRNSATRGRLSPWPTITIEFWGIALPAQRSAGTTP